MTTDLRSQLPLHIAMLVSAAEADGARCSVGRIGGNLAVSVENAPDAIASSLLAANFIRGRDAYLWCDDRLTLLMYLPICGSSLVTEIIDDTTDC